MVEKGMYRHFKGSLKEVLGVAKHSEALEELVVYRFVNDHDSIWARPIEMWDEIVEVDGKKVPRFELVKGERNY